jgi:hypothetical protein
MSGAIVSLAVLAALGMAGAMPFADAPNSPLHPLHQLIFPNDPAENVQVSLASATQALDRASSHATTRANDLDEARHYLDLARQQLAQVEDSDTRSRLQQQLSDLERRFAEIGDDRNSAGTGDQNGQDTHDQRSRRSASASPYDPQDSQGRPSPSPYPYPYPSATGTGRPRD